MLKSLKILLLISLILLPDYYVVDPAYRITNILMVLLVAVYFTHDAIITRKPLHISQDTKAVLISALSLIVYIYISDLFKNDSIEGTRKFLGLLPIPLMLVVFEHESSRLRLRKAFLIVFSISVIFAIMQIGGLNANLTTLLPRVGFIEADQFPQEILLYQDGRVTGIAFSNIGFALYLGIAIIILYYYCTENKAFPILFALLAFIVVEFFTQTRSAIYGLVPSIFIANHIANKPRIKEFGKTILIAVCVLFAIFLSSESFKAKFPRLFDPYDASVIERVQTNYYATLGTLREAPLFGIPETKAADIIQATAMQEGILFGDIYRYTTTHHNQLLYFFRYYGLIGVGLLILLYLRVFQKICKAPYHLQKITLLAIFIFDAQYSMLHNTKLINNILLWILLSLASVDKHTRKNVVSKSYFF